MFLHSIKPVNNARELEIAHDIRRQVFIEEQGVPEAEEFDAYEQSSLHFLFWGENEALGTARMRFIDAKIAKFERIAVRKSWRGQGVGRALVLAMIEQAQKHNFRHYRLGAQVSALEFYRKLGFEVLGEPFLDGGIPHRWMERKDAASD